MRGEAIHIRARAFTEIEGNNECLSMFVTAPFLGKYGSINLVLQPFELLVHNLTSHLIEEVQ